MRNDLIYFSSFIAQAKPWTLILCSLRNKEHMQIIPAKTANAAKRFENEWRTLVDVKDPSCWFLASLSLSGIFTAFEYFM